MFLTPKTQLYGAKQRTQNYLGFFGFLFFLSKYLNSEQKKPKKHRAEQGIAMAGEKKKKKRVWNFYALYRYYKAFLGGFLFFFNEIASKKLLSYIFSMWHKNNFVNLDSLKIFWIPLKQI